MLFGLIERLIYNAFRFFIFIKLLTAHDNWVKHSFNSARIIYEFKIMKFNKKETRDWLRIIVVTVNLKFHYHERLR